MPAVRAVRRRVRKDQANSDGGEGLDAALPVKRVGAVGLGARQFGAENGADPLRGLESAEAHQSRRLLLGRGGPEPGLLPGQG